MLNSKKILIAEDEKALATALDLKLKSAGFDTTIVTDGLQAIEAIKSVDYDLVLIDLIMPKLDGFKVLEEIQTLGKPVKVIVLSNLGQLEDIARAKQLGAKDFYIKSNTPIIEVVQRVVELTK